MTADKKKPSATASSKRSMKFTRRCVQTTSCTESESLTTTQAVTTREQLMTFIVDKKNLLSSAHYLSPVVDFVKRDQSPAGR